MQSAMNIHLQVNSTMTYSSSDYKDAYCHVDRSKILHAVRKVMPAAIDPIQKRLLGGDTGRYLLWKRTGTGYNHSSSGTYAGPSH